MNIIVFYISTNNSMTPITQSSWHITSCLQCFWGRSLVFSCSESTLSTSYVNIFSVS